MSSDIPPLKFTIATVTYNAGRQISHTIKSVEEQDYPHIEHLIVDGNSIDDTLEQIHHYQERNSIAAVRHEVNCLSEPDAGLYDAMNKALQMATGHYIVFLNAGDTLHESTTISKLAALCGTRRPAVIYGDTDVVNEQRHFVRHRRLRPPRQLTWRSFRNGMLVCHQAFFANMQLAAQTPYDMRYKFSSDFDWCIRILRQAQRQKMECINSHLTVADFLEGGMTRKNHKASLHERFRIMADHYGWLPTLFFHIWFVVRSFLKK